MSKCLEAALAYAERGWLVFPAPRGEKKSHKSKKNSGGLPWGMTKSAEQIRKDWERWPSANVGVPTGEVNGFFVVETDTKEGHGKDGAAALAKLEQQHGPLPPTLMARSPSGSVHRYFKHPGRKVWNSDNHIAPGVDSRGDGGMVIAPPSVRGDGEYTWINELPIAEAPPWLLDIVTKQKKKERAIDKDLVERAIGVIAEWQTEHGRIKYEDFFRIAAALRCDIGMEALPWLVRIAAARTEEGTRAGQPAEEIARKQWDDAAEVKDVHVGTIVHIADELRPGWREADPVLKKMLDEMSIIQLQNSVRIAKMDDGELSFLNTEAFNLFHANVSKEKRQKFIQKARRFKGVVLRPDLPPGAEVGGRLNIWSGWGTEPLDGGRSAPWRDKFPAIDRHLREVISNDDPKFFSYLLMWLAWTVHNPGKQAEVAIALQGMRGTGKGLFARLLARIIGYAHFRHISDRKHLVGSFNKHLVNCVLLFSDEALWPGHKQDIGPLNRLITEPTLFVEPKGVDSFQVPNCLHVILAGNPDWIVPAAADERRYAVNKVSDKHRGDKAYFKALDKEINGDAARYFFDHLLRIRTGEWHPRNSVPQTAALAEQKAQGRDGIDAFIEEVCDDGVLPWRLVFRGHPDTVGTDGLWEHLQANYRLHHHTPMQLGRELAKWGVVAWHSGGINGRKFPPLKELRAKFEAKWGKQEWSVAAEIWRDYKSLWGG